MKMLGIELPEPAGNVRFTRAYSEDQLRAIIRAAYERAAKVCDPYTHGQWFANAIRALGDEE